jgi:hypothetical protein
MNHYLRRRKDVDPAMRPVPLSVDLLPGGWVSGEVSNSPSPRGRCDSSITPVLDNRPQREAAWTAEDSSTHPQEIRPK